MNNTRRLSSVVAFSFLITSIAGMAAEPRQTPTPTPTPTVNRTVRVAPAQAAPRVVDFRLEPAAALAAKYPEDRGIERDPDVLFSENFESGDMKKWDQQRGRVVMTLDQPNSGRWCVQMPMERGKNHGGDAIKWFMPGADAVYARF